MANIPTKYEAGALGDAAVSTAVLRDIATDLAALAGMFGDVSEANDINNVSAAESSPVVATAPTVTAVADSAGTAVADASGDVGAGALANDLKAKYNAAVTLINSLKTKYNESAAAIVELRTANEAMRVLLAQLKARTNETIDQSNYLKSFTPATTLLTVND